MSRISRQATTLVQVPARVELGGDCLIWSGMARHSKPPPTLLGSFAGLAIASDDKILDFAREWGVLYICRDHGWPSSHNRCPPDWRPKSPEDLRARGYFACCPLTESDGIYTEPLAVWRRFSKQARAALTLIAEIESGGSGSPQNWASFLGSGPPPMDTTTARELICGIVAEWLGVAGVRPEVLWTDTGRTVVFGNRTVFGALAYQLLIALTCAPDLALCSECGNAFLPSRRPRTNQRHFCASCGRAAAVRASVRDHQRRAAIKMQKRRSS